MKDIKKNVLIVICVVLLVAAIITGILFFKNSSVTNESLRETIANAWTQDIEEEVPEFLAGIESIASFKVVDFTSNGEGHYSVVVEATSPDIYQEIIDYQKSITEMISVDEIDKQLKKIIEAAPLKTTQHTITVVYTDSEPEVKFTEEFIDAMYGYTYIYSIRMLEEVLSF